MFTDQEADELVSAWEILSREKKVQYIRKMAAEMFLEAWMDLYDEGGDGVSREGWRERYEGRVNAFQYTHLYFVLRKP